MLDEWTLAATLLGVIVAVLALTLEVWMLMNSKKNGRSNASNRQRTVLTRGSTTVTGGPLFLCLHYSTYFSALRISAVSSLKTPFG